MIKVKRGKCWCWPLEKETEMSREAFDKILDEIIEEVDPVEGFGGVDHCTLNEIKEEILFRTRLVEPERGRKVYEGRYEPEYVAQWAPLYITVMGQKTECQGASVSPAAHEIVTGSLEQLWDFLSPAQKEKIQTKIQKVQEKEKDKK